jgi:class III poly(R)-hydroxyalkanoic acid synthase PhaE subunit
VVAAGAGDRVALVACSVMTADKPSDWIHEWIEQQRERLERAGAPGQADAHGAAEWTDFARRWLDLLDAWPTHAVEGDGYDRRFADLFSGLPASGFGSQQTALREELAEACRHYQSLELQLRAVLSRVQIDALAMLELRAREQEQAGQPVRTARELYDLWVECGEHVYSQVAGSDAYCRLQGELGNAMIRLRARQQQAIESALRQFDLPTRPELNSMHQQLKELRAKVAALEAQLSTPAAQGP